ncbi:HEAT repeat domain-containing protein [Pelagicoccus mobilis]|uniref:HEAT repeat domain-containing protein n=1 Tax=Pelagicoccus mobilis TaxID=415221 RepID=A0A934RSS1_9BACT|nr:HEAT repeat domain-containing protein [Pelagicoccus mobilis]MBK1876910.1 HEAT repeat domain-containing protein [Pelagicoccus mobilis]
MKDQEKKAFIDRLRKGQELIDPSREEKEIASLWDQLGELDEPAQVDEESVSDFQDKLVQYRQGWQAALDKEREIAPATAGGQRPVWVAFSYGLVACVAAVLAIGGYAGFNFVQRANDLEAELRSTQETLALSLLEQSSPSKRLAGLATVSKIGEPSPVLRESVVRTFDGESNLNVRLAAVSVLSLLPREEALSVLLARLERESSPVVQLEILRQVVELVGEDSDADLSERIESIPMEPRVRSLWEEKFKGI